MSTPAEEVAIPEGPPAAEARLRARVPLKPVRKRKSPAKKLMGDPMNIIPEDKEVSDDSEGTRRVKGVSADKKINYRVTKPKQIGHAKDLRRKVARETTELIPFILQFNKEILPSMSYVIKYGDVRPLNISAALNIKAKPTTLIRVTSQDSFDAALMLSNAKEYIGAGSGEDVCVLHVASPQKLGAGLQKPGGDWKDGSTGQEAQLFYRSTISETLRPEYFPIPEEKIQCIYSPNVIVFREREEVEYSWMWVNKPEALPKVAVISMTVEDQPEIKKGSTKYHDLVSRNNMVRNMRLFLRVAGSTHHSLLVLNTFGCEYGHPAAEVAGLWLKVLQEGEFSGYFRNIIFAIADEDKHYYREFRNKLHDVTLSG